GQRGEVLRNRIEQEEREGADQEHDDDGADQPADEELKHGGWMLSSKRGGGEGGTVRGGALRLAHTPAVSRTDGLRLLQVQVVDVDVARLRAVLGATDVGTVELDLLRVVDRSSRVDLLHDAVVSLLPGLGGLLRLLDQGLLDQLVDLRVVD